MSLVGAPPAMAKATEVWRGSWNRQERPAASRAGPKWLVRNDDEIRGVPRLLGNTRPSGPSLANSRTWSRMASTRTDDSEIERTPASVLGPLRIHSLSSVRISCSVRSEEHTSELQSLMRISYA